MIMHDLYMSLPYDLSGARSKNRFRNEILWGLAKLFEVYRTNADFAAIFDYVCDIEIHLDSCFEFYQVKTSNNSSAFTLNKIIKQNKAGESILGKLYLIKLHAEEIQSDVVMRLNIVSNSAFKDSNNKLYSTFGQIKFSSLDQSCKDIIVNKLNKEYDRNPDIPQISELDFDNILYVYTSMDLFEPHNSLLGLTINFFNDVRGEEPKKPTALYRLLSDTVAEKACYELTCDDYDKLVQNKGITRSDIDLILDKYSSKTDLAVQKVVSHIESIDNYKERVSLKNGLSRITSFLNKSKPLQELELIISKHLFENMDLLEDSIDEIATYLFDRFASQLGLEYTNADKRAFMLLIMMKLEEGVYEKHDD